MEQKKKIKLREGSNFNSKPTRPLIFSCLKDE